MNLIDDIKRKKSIVDAFCIEALDIMEIGTVHNCSMSDVIAVLGEFQRGPQKMITSDKFKKRVAEFVKSHPEVSLANVARTFFLKDKRSVNRWCELFSIRADRDNQHSLLEQNDAWEAKYNRLLESHKALEDKLQKLSCMVQDMSILTDNGNGRS